MTHRGTPQSGHQYEVSLRLCCCGTSDRLAFTEQTLQILVGLGFSVGGIFAGKCLAMSLLAGVGSGNMSDWSSPDAATRCSAMEMKNFSTVQQGRPRDCKNLLCKMCELTIVMVNK